MTDPTRAAVEAWMVEYCPHAEARTVTPCVFKSECPDCLVAFAAAQRAEENEACEQIARAHSCADETCAFLASTIRARREGPLDDKKI
jgi:hypothetical protein